MNFMKNRPVLNCWPRQIQTIWLLPILTLYYIAVVILVYLTPTCFIRNFTRGWRNIRSTMNISAGITSRHYKHALSVMALLGLMFAASFLQNFISCSDFSVIERYGILMSIAFYALQSTVLIPLPFLLFNFFGVVFLNVFAHSPQLQRSPLLGPFLCFRVVTRGMFPDLVRSNVRYNLKVCEMVGLHNYIFEVVTDIPIGQHGSNQIREIVVPTQYMAPNGALFKARALQYALEPEVNILSPGDWIVHLDEETLLTEDAVIGIVNFTGSAEYSFGQGVITYGKGRIINWITTLADSIRVGIDYGCLRFSLGVLHKPIFSWKGSFIVACAEAEMKISFDHGPESSYAEDCFFACVAFSKGYKFGFVEGEMLENSTFTLGDFIQQRRRWMHGILLTALSKKIPFRYKTGPVLMSFSGFAMPLNLLQLPLGIFWPMPMLPLFSIIYSFVIGVILYLFILGTLQTFCIKKYGFFKCCFLILATIICGLVACVLENISSILVFWIPKASINTFYVVNKEVKSGYIKII